MKSYLKYALLFSEGSTFQGPEGNLVFTTGNYGIFLIRMEFSS